LRITPAHRGGIVSYSTDIGFLLIDMRFRFREINDDEKLTEADKKP
jgi:hypothetical protein